MKPFNSKINQTLTLTFNLLPSANAALQSDEQRVINYILKDYTRTARPAEPNTTVNVTFGIEIVQLVNVVRIKTIKRK
mgnify:CR=1 FL=1